jgi:predicted kinase
MAALIMMVGPSGSGKSTWIKEFLQSHPKYVVVSPDQIRKDLTGNISDQTRNKEVWDEAKEKTRALLSHGTNVIIDSVMVSEKDRHNFINYLKNVNYDLKYKIMSVKPEDLDELVARVEADVKLGRERSNVPRHAIERQLGNFYKDFHHIDKTKII